MKKKNSIKNRGKYSPSFKSCLTIIKILKHKTKYLFNTIYSQRLFKGLKIINKMYFNAYYISKNDLNKNLEKKFDIIKSRDDVILGINSF